MKVTHIESISTKIETTFNAKFEKLDEKKVEAEKYDALKQRVAKLERDSIMRESYDKCLNILIYGLKETKVESKQQSKTIFKAFLREALNLKHNSIKIIDLNCLPQRMVKKADKKVVRPIIVKLLLTYNKDKLHENISKLKAYNKNRATLIVITKDLPKIFYNQKKLLIPQFQAEKHEGKKDARWGAFDGKYCLYIENKCILPPGNA